MVSLVGSLGASRGVTAAGGADDYEQHLVIETSREELRTGSGSASSSSDCSKAFSTMSTFVDIRRFIQSRSERPSSGIGSVSSSILSASGGSVGTSTGTEVAASLAQVRPLFPRGCMTSRYSSSCESPDGFSGGVGALEGGVGSSFGEGPSRGRLLGRGAGASFAPYLRRVSEYLRMKQGRCSPQ